MGAGGRCETPERGGELLRQIFARREALAQPGLLQTGKFGQLQRADGGAGGRELCTLRSNTFRSPSVSASSMSRSVCASD